MQSSQPRHAEATSPVNPFVQAGSAPSRYVLWSILLEALYQEVVRLVDVGVQPRPRIQKAAHVFFKEEISRLFAFLWLLSRAFGRRGMLGGRVHRQNGAEDECGAAAPSASLRVGYRPRNGSSGASVA